MKKNINSIKNKINKLVPNIKWETTEPNNIAGFISQKHKTVETDEGTYYLRDKIVFVAEMYTKSNPKHFFYITYYTIAEFKRKYARTMGTAEYDKVFSTGKTIELLIKDFSNKLNDNLTFNQF